MQTTSKLAAVSVAFAVLAGCGSPAPQVGATTGPEALVSDQVHGGGMAGFIFLPPTVLAVPPAFTGPFDPDVKAAARVCAGTGACEPSAALAAFNSSGGTGGGPLGVLRAVPALKAYTAIWDTRRCAAGTCSLTPGASYRLHVYAAAPAGEVELGFADLQVIAPNRPVKVDAAGFSPLIKDLPYAIAFRVEKHPRPPTARIASPAEGFPTSAASLQATLEFQAGTDLLTGIAGKVGSVELLLNGAPVASRTLDPAAASGTVQLAVDLAGRTDQVLTLQARAFEGSGPAALRGDSTPIHVTLDRTPPTVAFSAPAPEAFSLNEGTVAASLTFADALSGFPPGGLHLELDGADVSAALALAGDGTATYRPSAPLAQGRHAYRAWAVDRAGNASAPTLVSFDVVYAAGAARLGPAGGTVAVDDRASPLFGVSLSLPAGALASATVVQIAPLPGVTGPAGGPALPGVSLPAFEILPHFQGLATPATIRVPLPDADRDGIVDGTTLLAANAHLLYRLAPGADWTRVETWVDATAGFIEAQTRHASQWVPVYLRWPVGTCVSYTVVELPPDRTGPDDSFTAAEATAQLAAALHTWQWRGLVDLVHFSATGCPAGSPELRLAVQDNLTALDPGTSLTFPVAAATDASGPFWIRVSSPAAYPDGTPGPLFYTSPYATQPPFLSPHVPWLRTLLHEIGHFVGLGDGSIPNPDQTPRNPAQWNVCNPPGSYSRISGATAMYRDHACGEGLPLTGINNQDVAEVSHHYGVPVQNEVVFADVTCASTTIPWVGGVACTATLDNRSGTTLTDLVVEARLVQGSNHLNTDPGLPVSCGAAPGVVPPGPCAVALMLDPSYPGAGGFGFSMAPGAANAVLELRFRPPWTQSERFVTTSSFPVQLVRAQPFDLIAGWTGGASANPCWGVAGFEFVLHSSDMEVTHLGYQDLGGDGLLLSHAVGLFDLLGHLLASAVVPAGTGGELVNGFRYVALPTPVRLTGYDNAYVVAGTLGPCGTDPVWQGPSSITMDQRASWVESRFESFPDASTLGFPSRFRYRDMIWTPVNLRSR